MEWSGKNNQLKYSGSSSAFYTFICESNFEDDGMMNRDILILMIRIQESSFLLDLVAMQNA